MAALKRVYVNGFSINSSQDLITDLPLPEDIVGSVQFPQDQIMGDFNYWDTNIKPSPTKNGSAIFKGDINHPTHTTTVTTVRIESTSNNPLLREAVETWFSISFYTPINYISDPKHEVIQQWHSLGGSPSFSINRRNGFYRIHIFTASDSTKTQVFGVGPCVPGEWVHFIARVVWADDLTGRLTVWKNGRIARLNNPSGVPWVVPNLGDVGGISDDWPLKAELGDLPYTVFEGEQEISILDWYGKTSREGDGASLNKYFKCGIYKSGITNSYFPGGGLRPGWDDPNSEYYIPPESRNPEISIGNVNFETRVEQFSHNQIFRSLDVGGEDPLETPEWWIDEVQINITSPANNSEIQDGSLINIATDAEDGQVDLIVNDKFLEQKTEPPYNFQIQYIPLNGSVIDFPFNGDLFNWGAYNNIINTVRPNNIFYVDGVRGQAIKLFQDEATLNADRAYISIPNVGPLSEISTAFTISFWLKGPATNISLLSNIVTGNSGIRIYSISSGLFDVYLYDSEGNSTTLRISSGSVMNPDTFNHFSVTYDGDYLRWYYNFEYQNQLQVGEIDVSASNDWRINAAESGFGLQNIVLDDFRIYDYAVSEEDIDSLGVDNHLGQLKLEVRRFGILSDPVIINIVESTGEYDGPWYVSNEGNDDNDGSEETPFATVTYAHSKAIPGDIIKLKRGSIFYEHFIPQKAGTALNPIQFEHYGDPELHLPIISGAKQLTGWVSIGNGLYKITDTGLSERVKFLRMDGEINTVATYPRDREYAQITGGSGNATGTIQDTVNLSGKNFTGGEVVTKKLAWCLDTMSITNHVGDTLTFSGGSSTYDVTVGWGYFVQNHRACCTQLGDWCQEGDDIVMYFGAANPNDYVIEAPYIERVYFNNHGNNHFHYIRFEMFNGGSDNDSTNPCFLTSVSQNLEFYDCEWEYMGNTVFYHLANNNNGFKINGGFSKNCLNIFYWNRYSAQTPIFTIENFQLENVGHIKGAGGNGSISYQGIVFSGSTDGGLLRNVKLNNIGYNGINFSGYEFLVENCYVENACIHKNDGGAFYSFGLGDETKDYDITKRVLRNNLAINCLGSNDGHATSFTQGFLIGAVEGYYLDDVVRKLTMDGNIAINCRYGLKIHNNYDCLLIDNHFYLNHRAQVEFASDNLVDFPIRNITFTGNVLYALEDQMVLYVNNKNTDEAQFGTLNNNYYLKQGGGTVVTIEKTGSGANIKNQTLAQWSTQYGHDADSHEIPTLSLEYEIAFNDTLEEILYPLERIRLDIDGNEVDEPFSLNAFTAKLLLDDLGPIVPVPVEERYINVNVVGSGVVSGPGTYEDGEEVELEAIPDVGWDFLHWSDVNGIYLDNPLIFISEENRDLDAIFVEDTPPVEEYTVTVIAGTGGSVSGGGSYTEDDEATLTATPDSGWHFVRWSNDVTDNPYSFTVTGDITLQAIFAQDEPVPGVIIVKGKFRIV